MLQELGAVVSLPSCHPVCDTHYTVINTQLSFLKKKNSKKFLKKEKKLVGRKPSGPVGEEQQLVTQHQAQEAFTHQGWRLIH